MRNVWKISKTYIIIGISLYLIIPIVLLVNPKFISELASKSPLLIGYLKLMLPVSIPIFLALVAWNEKNHSDKISTKRAKAISDRQARPFFYSTVSNRNNLKMETQSGQAFINVEIMFIKKQSKQEIIQYGAILSGREIDLISIGPITEWILIKGQNQVEEIDYCVFNSVTSKAYHYFEDKGELCSYFGSDNTKNKKDAPNSILEEYRNSFISQGYDYFKEIKEASNQVLQDFYYKIFYAKSGNEMSREEKEKVYLFLETLQKLATIGEIKFKNYQEGTGETGEVGWVGMKGYFIKNLGPKEECFYLNWNEKIRQSSLSYPFSIYDYIADFKKEVLKSNIKTFSLETQFRNILVYFQDGFNIEGNDINILEVKREIETLKQII